MMAANYLLAYLYMQEDFSSEETVASDESPDEESSDNLEEAEFTDAENTDVCEVIHFSLVHSHCLQNVFPAVPTMLFRYATPL